jgi:hypothetical protein
LDVSDYLTGAKRATSEALWDVRPKARPGGKLRSWNCMGHSSWVAGEFERNGDVSIANC